MELTTDSFLGIKQQKMGIPWCINCLGLHPEDEFTVADLTQRLYSPQKRALRKMIEHTKLFNSYVDKSCMMCGRTYDEKGHWEDNDKYWGLTARRVKEEFNSAGVFGIDDKKIEAVVAECRKSCTTLFRNRHLVAHGIRQYKATGDASALQRYDRMTFAGCLAHLITIAQSVRKKKMDIIGNSAVKL